MIQSENNVDQIVIDIVNTSLAPDVPTTTVKHGMIANFKSFENTRHIATSIQNSSDIDTTTLFINDSEQPKGITNVSESGEYRLEFTDVHTGESNIKNVSVLEDLILDLPTSAESVSSGEVFSTKLPTTYDSTYIYLSDLESNTTVGTVELATPEEGETTLGFNTYAAANGSLNESITVSGPGASIESVTRPGGDGALSPGTYEFAVRSEHGVAATSDNATVTLTPRSTNGLTTYAGTGTDRSDLGTAAGVREAIESGALTRTERVSQNDTVVYAVNASGLTGLSAARDAALETGDDLDRLDGLEFGVRSAAGGEDVISSDALAGAPRNSTVHADETGLYVVADGDDAFPADGDPEPGEEFTAEFRVTDDRLREAASDPPDGHRVTSTVTFDGASRDGSAGDGRERVASDDPAAGSGNDGGGGGTGGGTTGGTAPAGPVGDDPLDGAESDGTEEPTGAGDPAGDGDRIDPVPGVGFGSDPNAGRWTPDPSGPTVASPEAGTERAEASDSSEATGTDAAPTEGETGGTPADTANSERATPTYENAPIRTTAEDVPGFGVLQSVMALSLAASTAVGRRRRR